MVSRIIFSLISLELACRRLIYRLTLEYYTLGQWARDWASYFSDLDDVDASAVNSLDDLLNFCTVDSMQQRVSDWWGVPKSEQDCLDIIQGAYD